MLLTIGMIVKNEADKHLRDCLEQLRPLLSAVGGELVICDTGSTDNTVALCKEFTNKVSIIEWRDDFAWARNQALASARGRWFLFVDADEVFEDITELVAFFNTGEFRHYRSASIRIKNLHHGSSASSILTPRLVRRDKDTRFIGKIHEHLVLKEPHKVIESTLLHHGYNFDNSEEGLAARAQKHERNIVPMLEEYAKNPTDVRLIDHIASAYYSNAEYDKLFEILFTGLDLINHDINNIYFHTFYLRLIRGFAAQKDTEKLVEYHQKYMRMITTVYQSAVEMQIYVAVALHAEHKFAEALESYELAFQLFEKNQMGLLDNAIGMYISLVSDVLEDCNIIIRAALDVSLNSGDYATLLLWKDRLLQYNTTNTPQTAVEQQLVAETTALKDVIQTLIKEGNMVKAAGVLLSYAKVNPTDPEIPFYKRLLERSLQT